MKFISQILLVFLFYFLVLPVNQQLFSNYKKYLGKVITRIDFVGNITVKNEELLSKIQSATSTKSHKQLLDKQKGRKLTEDILIKSLKSLFEMQSFANIAINAYNYKGGVALDFQVTERSIINTIEFKGLDEITEQDLKDIILLEENSVFDESLVSQSSTIIYNKYVEKGFFNANIRYKTERIKKKNKTGGIKVIFIIDEGEEIKIAQINVLGAKRLKPKKIIKAMELEKDTLIQDGKFNEAEFEQDKDRVTKFMRSKGFLDAEVLESFWEIKWKRNKKKELDKKRRRVIHITYKIKEGIQYYFGGYHIRWDEKTLYHQKTKKPIYTLKQINKYLEFTEKSIGKIYNADTVQTDITSMSQLYTQKGHIAIRIIPTDTKYKLTLEDIKKLEASPKEKQAKKNNKSYYYISKLKKLYHRKPNKILKNENLKNQNFVFTEIVISEGPKGYIENIIVKGNEKTATRVIERELLFKKGDLFNSLKFQRSMQKVFNLGFFKDIKPNVRPGSAENQLNIIIEVTEQPTGNLSLGGGYSTTTGFSIFTEITERNLRGTGQTLSGKIEYGPSRSTLRISWTEPWLANHPLALTLSAAYYNSVYPTLSIISGSSTESFTRDSIIFEATILHRFFVNWGHYYSFSPSVTRVSNPSSLVEDSIYLLVNQGWEFKNRFTPGIYFDNIDNLNAPTLGVRADFSIDIVGSIFGGGDHYLRFKPKVVFYWWLFDLTFFGAIRKNSLRRWRFVFEHRISYAFTQITHPVYNNQENQDNPYIEVDDRLYLGGVEGLRGWDFNDAQFPRAWRNGASHRFFYNIEFRIPLEPSIIWLVFYLDVGALYENPNENILDSSAGSDEERQSIQDSRLTIANLHPSYYRYNWGFGVRLLIPVLPIRLYFSQRLIWDRGFLRIHPTNSEIKITFSFGDIRF